MEGSEGTAAYSEGKAHMHDCMSVLGPNASCLQQDFDSPYTTVRSRKKKVESEFDQTNQGTKMRLIPGAGYSAA